MRVKNFQRQIVRNLPAQAVEKWSPEVLSEGFVPFPKKLLRCMNSLFSGERAIKELCVLLAIVDFRRLDLSRQPSLDYLAFIAGLTPEDCSEAMQSLAKKGYISIQGDNDWLEIGIEGILSLIKRETKS